MDTIDLQYMPIVDESEAYVSKLLREQLTPDHRYHNLPHTLSVLAAERRIATYLALPAEDREILDLAALFHDTGFIRVYDGHEQESANIAADFLRMHGYPEEKIQHICDCILATQPERTPNTLLEAILRDADLNNLARTDYTAALRNLRHEWMVFNGKEYSDEDWMELNSRFLKSHRYHTDAARTLFGPQRDENSELLKSQLKERNKRKKRNGDKIISSRGAQMMVKTALRNHLDLSNLADNKANIMLSINALIITVAMPLGATRVEAYPYLIAPLGVLLLTCLVSMVFATLATRPIRMEGFTTPDIIKAGEANLFFFGNFFKMDFAAYRSGLEQVIAEETHLEQSIMRDLFHLGKSLGRKYHQLRICYNIFLIGIILTVLTFVVSFLLQR